MAATIQGTAKRTGYASTSSPATGTIASYTPLAGDIVAVWIRTGTSPLPSWTVPTNWVNPLGGTTGIASDTHSEFCIYHVVTAAEQTAGTTAWTFTSLFSSSQTGATYTIALRGVYQTTVIDTFGSTANSGSNASPHVLAGITPLRDNSLVLSCVVGDSTTTYPTAPTGWTFQAQNIGGQNTGALLSMNALTVANTAVPATNITPNSATRYSSITLAFSAASNASEFFVML